MGRRNGRPGDHLATDDYYGFTVYASKLRKDFWGSLAVKPLIRNLQEIASPLNDPRPVDIYRGPNYEISPNCVGETAPLFVGNTTVRTNPSNPAFPSLNLEPSLGNMSVGCNFLVYPG